MLEHAQHVLEAFDGVLEVLQHVVGDHQVELAISKWHRFDVRTQHAAGRMQVALHVPRGRDELNQPR